MSWEAIGGLITGVATAVAAVLVILQLRELNKQAKLQHFSDYTKRFNEIASQIPEEAMGQSFVLEGRPDRAQVMRALRRYFDLSYEEWWLHRHKLIADDIWHLWEMGIKAGCGKPAVQQCWAIIKTDTTFDAAFITFIESLIASRGASSAPAKASLVRGS